MQFFYSVWISALIWIACACSAKAQDSQVCNVQEFRQCFMSLYKATWTSTQEHLTSGQCSESVFNESLQCLERQLEPCSQHVGPFMSQAVERYINLFKRVFHTACDTVVEETCDIKPAQQCLQDYFYVLTHGGLGPLCGQAQVTLTCLEPFLDHCSGVPRFLVAMITNEIHLTSDLLCSQVTCSPDIAQQCLQEAMDMIEYPVVIATHSSLVCRFVQLSLMCSVNNTMLCSPDEVPAYLVTATKTLYQFTTVQCTDWAADNTGLTDGTAEFLSPLVLATLATNIWSSVDGVCSMFNTTILQVVNQGQTLMTYTSDLLQWQQMIGITLDKYSAVCFSQSRPDCSWLGKAATQSAGCDQVTARGCVDMVLLSRLVLDVNLQRRKWEEVCIVAYNMIACAQLNLGGCFDSSSQSLIAEMTQEVEELVGYECTQQGIPDTSIECDVIQPDCDVIKAWEGCTKALPDQTDMCKHMDALYDCFHDNTHGCSSAVLAPVEFYLHWYMIGCEEQMNQSLTLMPEDSLAGAAQCLVQLGYNLNNALLSYQDAELVMCTGLSVYATCLSGVGVPSLAQTYLSQYSQTYSQYVESICNATRDRTELSFFTEVSAECQFNKAVREVTTSVLLMYSLPYSSLLQQEQVCSNFPALEDKVMPLVTECSVDRRGQVADSLASLTNLYKGVCSHVRPGMKRSCDKEKVRSCLRDFGAFAYSAPADTDVCSKLDETFDCLYDHAQDCDDDFQSSLSQQVRSLYSISGSVTCDKTAWCSGNTQTDTPADWELEVCRQHEACDVFAWRNCVNDSNVYFLCQDLPTAQACILTSLQGCDPVQFAWAQSQMYIYRQQLGSNCEFIPAAPASVEQIHLDIIQCSTYISQTTDVTKQGLCTAIGQYYNCLNTFNQLEVPFAWQGILIRNGLIWGKQAYFGCTDDNHFPVGPDFDRNDFTGTDCGSLNGQICLRSLAQTLITEALFVPTYQQTEVCTSMETLNTCVEEQTAGCTSDLERTMISSSHWLMAGMANVGVCSDDEPKIRTCNPEAAMDRMVELGEQLIMDGGSVDQNLACSQLMPTSLRVSQQITGCDYPRRVEVEGSFRQLSAIVRARCSRGAPSTYRLPCLGPGEVTMCDLEEALTCMVPVQANLLQGMSAEQMCSGIPKMKRCIQKYSSGCDNVTATIIHNREHMLANRYGNVCPQLYCEECEARLCLSQLHTSLQYGTGDVCSSLKVARQCIYDNAHHCDSGLGEKLLQEVALIVGEQGEICDSTLSACVQTYMIQVNQILDYTPAVTFTLPNMTSDPVAMAMCSQAAAALQCVKYHLNRTDAVQNMVMNQTLQRIGRMIRPKCEGVTTVQCYSCMNATSNEECNSQPAQTCPMDSQICSTVVTTATVSKGCVRPDVCAQGCAGDMCSLCCQGNLCNQPVDHVLVEPTTCQPRTALWCGFQLMSALADSESLPCGQLEMAINCMMAQTETCQAAENMNLGIFAHELLHSGAVQSCLMASPACMCGQCSSVLLLSAVSAPHHDVQAYCNTIEDMFNKTLAEMDMSVCNLATMQSTVYNLYVAANYMDGLCPLMTETCDYYGQIYMHGATFKAQDGCNRCQCYQGKLLCTLMYCNNTDYKCPTVEPGQVGMCVEMCSGDGDCAGNQLCCGNGCGHTCQEPVPAESGCNYDDKDYRSGDSFMAEDNCNYCFCNNGQVACTEMQCPETEYQCPKVEPGQVGMCVEMCGGDGDCTGNQLCCSNGCGHTCQEPVPAESGCNYGDMDYRSGDSFMAEDNCNYCFCNNGQIACTRMYCPDIDPVPATCDLYAIQGCMQQVDLSSLLAVMTNGDADHICRSAVSMLHCVEHQVTFCPSEVVTMVTNQLWMTLTPISSVCDLSEMLAAYLLNLQPHEPDEVDVPRGTCSMLEAIKCVADVEGTASSCSDYQELVDCVHNSTSGCVMVDVVPVWYQLQLHLQQTGCDLDLHEPSMVDPLYPIASCTLEFGTSLSQQMSQSYMPLIGGVCDSVDEYMQCLQRSNTSSLGRVYISNLQASLSNIIQMCSTYKHAEPTSSTCHFCQMATSLEQCDAGEPDHCFDNQMCSTILHHDVYTGVTMVTKGCADMGWCQQWTGCDPQSLTCAGCCYGDMCNYLNVTANRTMTTTTKPPKNTTTDQCDLQPVVEHLVPHMLMLMTLNTMPGSQRSSICQYLTEGAATLMHDLDPKCSAASIEQVQTVSQLITSWTAAECPREPDQGTCWEAAVCVAGVIGFNPDQNATCRAIHEAKECMQKHLRSCYGAGIVSLNRTLQLLSDMDQVICVPNKLDQYKVPDCVDVTVVTSTCNQVKAEERLHSLQHAWMNPFMTTTRFCSLRKTAMKAIHDNLAGCDDSVAFTSFVMETVQMTENTCPDTWCPIGDKCQLQRASGCLQNISQLIASGLMSNKLDANICRSLTFTHHCVMNATEGCHWQDRQSLLQELSALSFIVSPICEASPPHLPQCLANFHIAFDGVLKLEEGLVNVTLQHATQNGFGGMGLPGVYKGSDDRNESPHSVGYGINLPGYNSFRPDPIVGTVTRLLSQYGLNMSQLHDIVERSSEELHNLVHIRDSLCQQLKEAHSCIHENIHQISGPQSFVAGTTFEALERLASDLCQDQRCHSCNGIHNNTECNSQASLTCKPLQMCQTKLQGGHYYKGCVSALSCDLDCRTTDETCYCCRGNNCNNYSMALSAGQCDVQSAVNAAQDLLLKSLNASNGNARIHVYDDAVLMADSTSGCYGDAYVNFNIVGQRLMSYAATKKCSGDDDKKSCDISDLSNVVAIVSNPHQTLASMEMACRLFNSTLGAVYSRQQNHGCCGNRSSLITTVLSVYNQLQDNCNSPNLDLVCKLISDWPCDDGEGKNNEREDDIVVEFCSMPDRRNSTDTCSVQNAMQTCFSGVFSTLDVDCDRFSELATGSSISCIGASTSSCGQYQIVPLSLLVQSTIQYCESGSTLLREGVQTLGSPIATCLMPLVNLTAMLSKEPDVCMSASYMVGHIIRCLETTHAAGPFMAGLVTRINGIHEALCFESTSNPQPSDCKLCPDVCTNVSATTMCPNFPNATCVADCNTCTPSWFFRGDDVTNMCPKFQCPTVEPGQVGMCVEMCSGDSNCTGNQLCCSNGCGHTCQEPVPAATAADQGCDVELLSHAMTSWVIQLATYPMLSLEDKQRLCSSEESIEPLSKNSSQCPSFYKGTFLSLLPWVQEELKAICPERPLQDVCEHPQCDIAMAEDMMTELSYYLGTASFSDGIFCQRLENILDRASCMLYNCSDADTDDIDNIDMALTFVRSQVQGRCPHLLSSKLCRLHQQLNGSVAEAEEDNLSGVCDLEQAKRCVFSVTLPGRSDQEYCRKMSSAVDALSACVIPIVMDCDPDKLIEIQAYYQTIFSERSPVCGEDYNMLLFREVTVKDTCEEDTCSLDKIMSCIKKLNGTECENQKNGLDCGLNYAVDCNPLERVAVATIFMTTAFEKGLPLSCAPNWMIGVRGNVVGQANAMSAAAIDIFDCIDSFQERVEQILTAQSSESICDTFSSLMSCYETAITSSELPEAVTKTMRHLVTVGKPALMFACSEQGLTVPMAYPGTASCKSNTALDCVRRMTTSVLLSSVLAKDGKAWVCESLLQSATCLNSALEGCSDEAQVGIRHLYQTLQTLGQLSGTCSPRPFTCTPEEAVHCISQLAGQVHAYGSTVSYQQVCRSLEDTEECITQTTSRCDDRTKQLVMETLEPVRCRAQAVCPSSIQASHPVQGDIHVCESHEDTVRTGNSENCHPARALRCLQDLLGHVGDTVGHDSHTTCSSYTEAVVCFITNIRDCGEVPMMMAIPNMLHVIDELNPVCLEMVTASCRGEMEAGCDFSSCLMKLMSAATNKDNVCVALSEAKQCVDLNTVSCPRLSKMFAEAYLLRQKSQILAQHPSLQCEDFHQCSQRYLHQVGAIRNLSQSTGSDMKDNPWMASCSDEGQETGPGHELMYRCSARVESLSCTLSYVDTAQVSVEIVMAIRSTIEQLEKFLSNICEEVFYGVQPLSDCDASCVVCTMQQSGLESDLLWLLSLVDRNSTTDTPFVNSYTFCRLYEERTSSLQQFMNDPGCNGEVSSLSWYEGHLQRLTVLYDQYCMRQCNISVAEACFSQLQAVIQTSDPASQSGDVCSIYDSTMTCVEQSLSACQEDIATSYMTDIQSLLQSSGIICVTWPTIEVSMSSMELKQDGRPLTVDVAVTSPLSPNVQIQLVVTDIDMSTCLTGEKTSRVLPNTCSMILDDDTTSQTLSLFAHIDHKKVVSQNVSVGLMANYLSDGAIVSSKMVQKMNIAMLGTGSVGVCNLLSEPKIVTFDGLPYYSLAQGEYILYRQASLNQKVHVGFQRCTTTSTETCPCVVMVKSGDDVFIVDKCRRRGETTHALTFSLFQNGELTPHTEVYKSADSRRFKFALPSGTVVSVEETSLLLGVWMKTSPLDRDQTAGLCGTYDGYESTDFTLRNGTSQSISSVPIWQGNLLPTAFIGSWRAETSLFSGAEPEPSFQAANYTKCDCNQEPGTCVPTDLVSACNLIEGEERITDFSLYRQTIVSRRRRRRQEGSIWDDIDIDENYNPNLPPWPTESGITEAEAVQACEDTLTTAPFWDICVVAVDTTVFRSSCVTDILLEDSLDARLDAYENLKVSCRLAVISDPSIADSLNIPYETLVAYLSSLTCLNDCSGQGQCQNDTCICDAGFTTVDCSVAVATPPVLFTLSPQLYSELIAMTTGQVTQRVTVSGNGFQNLDSLTCHLKQQQLTDQGFIGNGAKSLSTATFLTSGAVLCDVSGTLPVSAVQVSVSNTGHNQSNSLLYVIQDPVCYNCDPALAQCQVKTTSCLIDGQCYPSGANNPADPCFLCDPSTNQWEYTTSALCPPQSTTTTAAPSTTTPPKTTTSQPPTTTPVATTSQPPTTTPVATTTTQPPTTTTVKTTSQPPTTTPVATTSQPQTTTPVATQPPTTTVVKTTSQPPTTTPVATTSQPPTTTTPVATTTTQPHTTTPVATTTTQPPTTTPVATTTSPPRTTTPVATTTSPPKTTTPVATTTSPPKTTTPVATTTSPPKTTTPVATTTSPPKTTTPVATTTSPPKTTTPVATTTSPPKTTTPVATTTSPPKTTTPVATTTSPPRTTTPVVTTPSQSPTRPVTTPGDGETDGQEGDEEDFNTPMIAVIAGASILGLILLLAAVCLGIRSRRSDAASSTTSSEIDSSRKRGQSPGFRPAHESPVLGKGHGNPAFESLEDQPPPKLGQTQSAIPPVRFATFNPTGLTSDPEIYRQQQQGPSLTESGVYRVNMSMYEEQQAARKAEPSHQPGVYVVDTGYQGQEPEVEMTGSPIYDNNALAEPQREPMGGANLYDNAAGVSGGRLDPPEVEEDVTVPQPDYAESDISGDPFTHL